MINLSRKKLLIPFLICFGLTLFAQTLPIFYLSPLIVMTLYRFSTLKSLVTAFIIGLILGLFSFESRFGMIGLILVMTSMIISPLKQYFFADRLYTLPLMTYLFGALFTLLLGFFSETFSTSDAPWNAFFTEVMIMPLGDALFAFGVFVFPISVLQMVPKIVRHVQLEKSTVN